MYLHDGEWKKLDVPDDMNLIHIHNLLVFQFVGLLSGTVPFFRSTICWFSSLLVYFEEPFLLWLAFRLLVASEERVDLL